MKRIVLVAALASALSTQLGSASADETNTKVGRPQDGIVIAPDTADNWWQFTRVVDGNASDELSGARPPGGLGSWDELWLGMIRAHEESQQNYERYVRYIVDTRRKLGLPDLPGYRNERSK